MTRTPATHLRLLVHGTKAAVIGTLTFLAVLTANTVTTEGVTAGQHYPEVPHQARIVKLMALHQCSLTGFEADVIPGSALVLRDDRIKHVSFDDGWATYTGDAPGELVAVCRVNV